jgi:insulysin
VPADAVKQMLGLVDSLSAQFPFVEEKAEVATSTVASAVPAVEVKDAVAFKASLNPSKAAMPVVSFDQHAKDPSGEGDEVARIAEAVLKATAAPAAVEDGEPKANL